MSAYCHYLLASMTLGLLIRFSITSAKELPAGLEIISLKMCGKIFSVKIANVAEERFLRDVPF